MDTKKRKTTHNYNLRSRTRKIQLRSRSRRQRNRDASSSNIHQESPNQQSSNSTQQHQRSNRSHKRHGRGTRRPRKSSSVSNRSNDASDDVECVICLDTVVDREMKYIPCGHGFHKICCNNWLTVNDACPVCRTVVASRTTTRRTTITYDNRDRIIHDTPISDIIYFFSLSVIRT